MSGRFRRTYKKSKGSGRGNYAKPPSSRGNYAKPPSKPDGMNWDYKQSQDVQKQKDRRQKTIDADETDRSFGYDRFCEGEDRVGWMFNIRTTSVIEEDTGLELSAVDCFFVQADGGTFKATVITKPYFLCQLKKECTISVQEFESYLMRRFENLIADISVVEKENLEMLNHLSGLKSRFLKLEFRNINDLMNVRNTLKPIIFKNKAKQTTILAYEEEKANAGARTYSDVLDDLVDMREYDVQYVQRVCIDKGIRVGLWYNVSAMSGLKGVNLTKLDMTDRPPLKVFAFDIETTKLPLKFPDSKIDHIMMISYMMDGQGYLIVNREIVSEDIADFEYTPKPEFEGPFVVFNVRNELELLKKFFSHIQHIRPHIFVTYNGDFFDWPFIRDRAVQQYGLDPYTEIGVWENNGEFLGRFSVHLDAFYWVKRDSYLPQGSQGLKAVAKAKLNYDPLELDPEEMLPYAQSKPHVLAAYSVSDAVATYYLYMKYVHLFIFSLSTIIPMPPSDVLRKGSGTLCELLLMVMAYENNIICPNKQQQKLEDFYEGHLLDSSTYIGGHVECLESGCFREDFDYKFRMDPAVVQGLIDKVDRTLEFAIGHEGGVDLEKYEISNYDELKAEVVAKLEHLRDNPVFETKPFIYHLDVGAMYPNIILSNRLQPMAIVDKATCAACDFNEDGNNCQRKMVWSWKGKYFPISFGEYRSIKSQLEYEAVKDDQALRDLNLRRPPEQFTDLPLAAQHARIRARVKQYSHTVYKKYTTEKVMDKEAIICQRENPFYVNTVRAFRDRRYDYKRMKKDWSKKLKKANTAVEIQKCKDMVLLADSLQLAHKCILNSFYGYVMRKGARWQSIEMAGVVTKTGAEIIKDARVLVEGIGRPLELDTDGIWCMLPSTFPENFEAKTNDPKHPTVSVSYPCSMLNLGVHDKYTNHQYQDRIGDTNSFTTKSENSIYFEVDGPYRCMVLPASRQEGKDIKKRYAVFNQDGSLAELKGFEIKRRGELKLIKIFQGEVFAKFLEGRNLQECFEAVGASANKWVDVLKTQGVDLEDDEVFEYISENKNMSKSLEEYGNSKSTAITTAKRLGEFLGSEMVKDKGLNCRFIIANKPVDAPTSQRAVPVAIFSAEPDIKRHYIRKWLKDTSIENFDIRALIDWDYYLGRLGAAIQKIITIPAAFQGIENPVPRIVHPDWLLKRNRAFQSSHKQTAISKFFDPKAAGTTDMEDMLSGNAHASPLKARVARVRRVIRRDRDDRRDEPVHIPADADRDDGDEDSVNLLQTIRQSPDSSPEKSTDNAESAPMEVDADAPEEDSEEAPDKEEDFAGWLRFHKNRWKGIREAKKRKRLATRAERQENLDGAISLRGGLRNYIEQQSNAVRRKYWQILQISPTSSPGVFNVWAFTDDTSLQCIPVRVPRRLYLNCRVESDHGQYAANATLSNKTLPHGRKSMYLYEMEMDEAVFLRQSKKLSGLLTHPDVEGVYETKVPLDFRFVVEKGCVCRLNATSLDNQGATFTLDSLRPQSTAECPYLETVRMKRVFLVHSTSTDGQRGLIAQFVDGSEEATLVVVNPFGEESLEPINTESLIRQIISTKAEDWDIDVPQLHFTIVHVKTHEDGYRAMRRVVDRTRRNNLMPTVVILQSPLTAAQLLEHFPELQRDMPLVRIPYVAADSQYAALQWYTKAVRVLIMRHFECFAWWAEQLEFCRYASVPIGNLETDVPSYVADIFYARNLQEHEHLLWCSSTSRPDLGGNEEDENYFANEHMNPEITAPGCYRDVSVVVEMQRLAITAILKADLIEDLEGVAVHDPEGEGDDDDGAMSGTRACRKAFQILVKLVTNWSHLATTQHNLFADKLMIHMYRWIRSPTSLLYDPALHRYTHGLMKKVFMQLVARFRRLEAPVIYANFQKLIIDTRKKNISRAVTYAKYLIEAIESKELFDLLGFSSTHVFQSLLFLDRANYSALPASGPREVDDGTVADDSVHLSKWNIATFLPPLAQAKFESFVHEFLVRPHEHVLQLLQDAQHSSGDAVGEELVQSQLRDYLSTFVRKTLQTKLLAATKEISYKLPVQRDNEEDVFPQQPGSHLQLRNPALEFVKMIVRVLSLDKLVRSEAAIVRTNMLKLVNVRSFAQEAEFVDPCVTFVLPDVTCPRCNTTRDVDLTRDEHLDHGKWFCEHCGHHYDTSMIEAALVEIVQRRSVTYQVQDLRCKKCRQVKVCNMNEYCPCSGVYENVNAQEEFRSMAKVFLRIAEYHKLDWLRENVLWLSQTPA